MLTCRRGFTLVEVIVAILLIDVGLLTLVGASTRLVRQTTELRARSTALHAATNRLQALGSAPCAAGTGSAIDPRGFQEAWSVTLRDNHVRELRDSVSFGLGSLATVVLETRLPC